jgi:hypothetical protein
VVNDREIALGNQLQHSVTFDMIKCRNEAWFLAELAEYYKTRLSVTLSETDMNTPVPISGGLVLVGGLHLRLDFKKKVNTHPFREVNSHREATRHFVVLFHVSC